MKKEILYNGALVHSAYGEFSYKIGDSIVVTLPFLYTYGRITIAKDEFEKMVKQPTLIDVDVYISFQPYRVSDYPKNMYTINTITFTTEKWAINEIYIAPTAWVYSYWAITTIKDCYLVFHNDHTIEGRHYYIPYENHRRKQLKKNFR